MKVSAHSRPRVTANNSLADARADQMRSADGQQNNQDAGQIAGKRELTLLALPGRRDRGIGLMAVLLGRRRSLSGVFLYRVGGLGLSHALSRRLDEFRQAGHCELGPLEKKARLSGWSKP